MSMKFVVNHVSDETKKGGIVDRYEPAQFTSKDDAGNDILVNGLVAYVHWPSHPIPFIHQENHEELAFENVYIPEHDQEDEEDNELNEAIVEKLGEKNSALLEEIMNEIEGDDEGEEQGEGEGEETEN